MIGIISFGAYVPYYRLSRAEIAKAWGKPTLPGEKAVANYDEDSLTMAVAAARDCMMGIEPSSIDGVYFASTTFPYREKQAAATVSTVLDLNKETFTVDISNSLRGGTSAMRVAIDAINASSAKNILVCAADCRLGLPNGDLEMAFGDGAAALILGEKGVIATIEGNYSINDEITEVWRPDMDMFVHSWEQRFIREAGYTRVVFEAVSTVLKKYNLDAKDFSKAVFYAPNPTELTAVARKLGLDKTQDQDSLYNTVGNTGSALSMMMLVAALEEAKAGDRILFAGYGDGCDIYVLKVTKEIEKVRDRRGITSYLASKQMLDSYQKYLQWRGIVPAQPPLRPVPEQPSAVALWRDREKGLPLHGIKCKKCGTIQYQQRVCINCRAKDEFEDYPFADKIGRIFTFSHDYLAATVDPPITEVVIDFEGGGRLMCDMIDRDPEQVKVGMPVEMTFRKLGTVQGIHNYWWKCRPVRG